MLNNRAPDEIEGITVTKMNIIIEEMRAYILGRRKNAWVTLDIEKGGEQKWPES